MPNTLEFFVNISNKLEKFTNDEERVRLLELQRKLQDINNRINDDNIQKLLSKTEIKHNKEDTDAISEKIKWVFIAFGIFFGILFLLLLVYWIYSIVSSSKTETSSVKNIYTEELLKNKFTEGNNLKEALNIQTNEISVPIPIKSASIPIKSASIPKSVNQEMPNNDTQTFKTPLYKSSQENEQYDFNIPTLNAKSTESGDNNLNIYNENAISTISNQNEFLNNAYGDIDNNYKSANSFDTFNYTNNSKKLLGGKKKK